MSVALVCMSHSPLIGFAEPSEEVREEVRTALGAARTFVESYDPDLIISFAPDHYNGFFYEVMPPYCIGLGAVGVGDFGTAAGALDVPAGLARRMLEVVLEADVDTAVSQRMEIDHGGIQPLQTLIGDIAAKPVIPVFINGVAGPFTPMRRVRRLGQAIGAFVAQLDQKVLLIGSGGLSHDPPVPQWATATTEQKQRMLNGRHPSQATRDRRQQQLINAGQAFARGEADIMDLNPEWDKALMQMLANGELAGFDAWTAEGMADVAGNSAHEVRTWIAACNALATAAGTYQVSYSYYRPIREYIVAFAVMIAEPTSMAAAQDVTASGKQLR